MEVQGLTVIHPQKRQPRQRQKQDKLRVYLTQSQVAEVWGKSKATVSRYRHRAKDPIPFVGPEKAKVVEAEKFYKWLDRQ